MAAHRTPNREDRIRDAERTKARLLDAALDEFSEHGFRAARVSEIARRAGVNKQLVNYYFGSKEGLYRALRAGWRRAESGLQDAETVAAMVVGYLRHGLRDPRGTRWSIREGLDVTPAARSEEHEDDRRTVAAEQAELRRRQRAGELLADLDPAAVQLAATGMVIVPIVMPQLVHDLFDTGPFDPDFEERYASTLELIINRLRPDPTEPARSVSGNENRDTP